MAQTLPMVTLVGGGMITRTQILPTLFHRQREGQLGEIQVCSLNAEIIREHARRCGVPANRISAVRLLMEPASAEAG